MSTTETPVAAKPYHDDDKVHLFLAYFGILSLIPFLMFKDKRSDPQKEFVYWHGRQGLALSIVVIVLWFVLMIFSFVVSSAVPILGGILSCLLWLCLMVVGLGGAIMGWIKAFGGQ